MSLFERLHALWRSPRGFVSFVVSVAIVLRLVGIDDPWSMHHWNGEFGAFATGTPARNFLEHGFLETFGVPFTTRVELADGSLLHWYYLHHPPTYMWFAGAFLWLFGPVEWGLRLLAVLGSTAAAVAGYAFARRVVGERAARVAACVWIAAPYGLRDGMQLWTEVPIAGTAAMTLLAYLAWLAEPNRKRLVHLCLWYAGGAALDWPAHFYGPVIALHAGALAWRRRERGLLVAPLALFGTSLAVVAAVGAHFAAVVGRDELVRDFQAAFGSAAGAAHASWFDAAFARGFLVHQWHAFVDALTLPGALLLGVGLVALPIARRPWHETLLVALALPPGVVYVFAFPGRSANHLFFMAVALPALGAFVGAGAEAFARVCESARRRAGAAVAALCAGCVLVVGAAAQFELRAATNDGLARRLAQHPSVADAIGDPEALVIAPPGRGAWLGFHARAPVLVEPLAAADLAGLVTTRLARLEPQRRAFVLADLSAAEHPLLPDDLREPLRQWALEFDAAARVYGRAEVIELVDDFGTATKFGLYRLPTGGVPLAEEPPR
jgi:4-amino-4-deoxy-L-arabinose transferase-like glycosyltransferase